MVEIYKYQPLKLGFLVSLVILLPSTILNVNYNIMKKIKEQKLGIKKFQIAKINNPSVINGGDYNNGDVSGDNKQQTKPPKRKTL